jgi:phenylacetate-coenzyme A ligase PaaK-like adenylate-forming protein
LVHPLANTAHVEIIDASGKEVTEVGASGEIVITALRPTAFPIIRYTTGDSARIVRLDCPCGATTPLLQIEGRIEIDRLRIRGGEIQTNEVGRVLASLGQYLEGNEFEARVGEVMLDNSLVPQLTIACIVKEGVSLAWLAARIAESLRVAPDYTWAHGVSEGKYVPLVLLNEAIAPAAAKRKRLVRV